MTFDGPERRADYKVLDLSAEGLSILEWLKKHEAYEYAINSETTRKIEANALASEARHEKVLLRFESLQQSSFALVNGINERINITQSNQEEIKQALNSIDAAMCLITRQLSALKAQADSVENSIPNKDFNAHFDDHLGRIENKKRWDSRKEKWVTSYGEKLGWGIIIVMGLALWEWFQRQVK